MDRRIEYHRKNIVIIGGGFSGLAATQYLSNHRDRLNGYKVFLIDKNHYHTFVPLLYEAATTDKELANNLNLKAIITYNLDDLVVGPSVYFVHDEVIKIDSKKRKVFLRTSGSLDFEYLVLGVGTTANYYNLPGLAEHSFTLKTFIDAIKIREAVTMNLYLRQPVEIIIGGGGSTGVELAAELKVWQSNKVRVKIIQQTETILPGFDKKIIDLAVRRLESLGVQIITNGELKKLEARTAYLASGQILDFDIFIWTGGNQAPNLTKGLSLKAGIQNRLLTEDNLECFQSTERAPIVADKIYGIGDVICYTDPKTKKPVPGMARPAISQGKIAAKNIIREINGLAPKKIYKPMNYPYIIPLGGKYAVAHLGGLTFKVRVWPPGF